MADNNQQPVKEKETVVVSDNDKDRGSSGVIIGVIVAIIVIILLFALGVFGGDSNTGTDSGPTEVNVEAPTGADGSGGQTSSN